MSVDEFNDKVVLITGAGRGLGRQAALAFASLGAIVAANDINPLSLDETVQAIQQVGGTARAYVFDVAKRMPIEGMLSQVLDHFGRIDCLVNHAAVRPDRPLLEMDEWEFHRTLEVNLGGAFFTTQLAGRIMQQQGGGAITNLIASAQDEEYVRGHAAVSASQAGLLGLTQAAANELAPRQVRVNAVCCGMVLSGLASAAEDETGQIADWINAHPEADLGDRPLPVGAVLFLSSQAAASIAGKVFSFAG